MSTHNREQWLNAITEQFRPVFESQGYPLPPVQVTCGFPSTGGTRQRHKRVIGEIHDRSRSAGDRYEIFISPVNANSVDVAAVLVHELVHAAVGIPEGHGPIFRAVALAVGLQGGGARNNQFTATVASPHFESIIRDLVEVEGEYPHAELNVDESKKQTTRLIKLVCPTCGVTARASATAILKGRFLCGNPDHLPQPLVVA